MQGGKGAMASVMEAAANVAASAKSGLDKTKAVVEDKVERMSTKDEVEKDMATLRKEEKLDLAELRKHKAYAQNAAAASALPGAVSPNFTDGGGFNTIGSDNKPAEIISSNTDHRSPVSAASNVVPEVVDGSLRPATGQVGSGTNSTIGNFIGTPVVDSHLAGMPEQVVQPSPAVDSNPTHTGMPVQGVQPIAEIPAQVVQTGGEPERLW